jgi:hypothetical protein
MQLVMVGEHHAVEPQVLELLHGAAAISLALPLQLVSVPADAGMTTVQQLALQRVCLGLCLAVAAAMQVARQFVLGMSGGEELETLPVVAHCMHAVQEIIKLLEDVNGVDFRQLQSAVIEVRCLHLSFHCGAPGNIFGFAV